MAADTITRRAFAKVNLDLRVGPLGADGYHPLSTVFQAIALHDTLRFDRLDGHEPFALSCDDPDVPMDERNLVWRAAATLWTALGRAGPPRGVRVTLDKRIPAQGGLGGGSADAAVALVALASLWEAPPGLDLARLGVGLGADVVFFLVGGTARATGRGERLEPWPDLPPLEIVLAVPAFGISTAQAFRWFDEDAARGVGGRPVGPAAGRNPADPEARRPKPEAGLARWCATCRNDLEGPVCARHPVLADLRRELEARGAVLARMSGSGSAVFGVFHSAADADAAAAGLAGPGRRLLRSTTLGRDEYRRHAFGPDDPVAVPVALPGA